MTRHYSLVIEGEEGSYSAYVPELPAILITGKAMNELTARATEAIRIYLSCAASPTSAKRNDGG